MKKIFQDQNKQYIERMENAVTELSRAVTALQYNSMSLSKKIDMIAVLANALSSTLMKKKILKEKDLSNSIKKCAKDLDDYREAEEMDSEMYAQERYFNNLLNSDFHGNA